MLHVASSQQVEDTATIKTSPSSKAAEMEVDVHSSYIQSHNSGLLHEWELFDSKPNLHSHDLIGSSNSERENLPSRFSLECTEPILTTKTTGEFVETFTLQGEKFKLPEDMNYSSSTPSMGNALIEPTPLQQQRIPSTSPTKGWSVMPSSPLSDKLKSPIYSEHSETTELQNTMAISDSARRTNKVKFSLSNVQDFELTTTPINIESGVSKKSGESTHLTKRTSNLLKRSSPGLALRLTSVNGGAETQMSHTRDKNSPLLTIRSGVSTPLAGTKAFLLLTPKKKNSILSPTQADSIPVSKQKRARERCKSLPERVRESSKCTNIVTRKQISCSSVRKSGNAEFGEIPTVVRTMTPLMRETMKIGGQGATVQPEALVLPESTNEETMALSTGVSDRLKGKSMRSHLRNRFPSIQMKYAPEEPSAVANGKTRDNLGEMQTKTGVPVSPSENEMNYSLSHVSNKSVAISPRNAKNTVCTSHTEGPNTVSYSVKTANADASYSSISEEYTVHQVLPQPVGFENLMLGKALKLLCDANLRAFDVACRNLLNNSKKQLRHGHRSLRSTRQGPAVKPHGITNSPSNPVKSSRKLESVKPSLSVRRQSHFATVPPEKGRIVSSHKGNSAVSLQPRGTQKQKKKPVQRQTLVRQSSTTKNNSADVNTTKKRSNSGGSGTSNKNVNHRKGNVKHKSSLPKANTKNITERFHCAPVSQRQGGVHVSFSLKRPLTGVSRLSLPPFEDSFVNSGAVSPFSASKLTPRRSGGWRSSHSASARPENRTIMFSSRMPSRAHSESIRLVVSPTPRRPRGNIFSHKSDIHKNMRIPSHSDLSTMNNDSPGYTSRLVNSSRRSGDRRNYRQSSSRASARSRSTVTGVFDWPVGVSNRAIRRLSPTRPLRISPAGRMYVTMRDGVQSPRSFVSTHLSSCKVNAVLECTERKPGAQQRGPEESLFPGDVILECNERPMISISAFQQTLEEALENSAPYVMLRVLRDDSNVVVQEYILP